MMESTSPRLLSPLGTQRSNSPSTGSSTQAQQDFGAGYATSELSANLLSPSPSSMASKISHDIQPSTSVRKKNFKTEYKSKFTPFDQYAYNEVTDSFVKQTTNLVESQLHSSISTSRSNQDLAYLQQESNYNHLGAQQAISTLDSTLCESSVNGEDHQQARGEPWYKEVVRRNEKANEYRFKSEVGHSSPLLGYASNRSDSPYANSELKRQINSPFGVPDSAGAPEQGTISLSDARSQHSEHSTDLSHQDPKQKYKFTPNDYNHSDHMIAHMANNNNFALPKEQTDQKSAAPRRAQLSNVGVKAGTRSTAQIRSRSQSTRRQPTSTVAGPTNARPQPISSKSSQTTPTKTAVVPRQPAPRTQLTSAKPTSRLTSVSRSNATGGNVRPSSTANSKTSVGLSRTAASSGARRTLASSNQTTRLAAAKPKSAANETFSVDRPKSSSVASKKPTVPPARTNPVPRTTTSARSTLRTSTNAPASGRMPPTNVKTSSSSRTTAVSSAKNKVSSNKSPPNLSSSSATSAVKSIKTSGAMAAKETPSAVAPRNLNDQPNETANVQPNLEHQSDKQQYKVEPNLVQLQQHRCYDTDEPNWIFTTTQAGNMLADELAQAEKAAMDARKVEVPSSVQPRDSQNELDRYDDSSSPDSTLEKRTPDQAEETKLQFEEKQETSEIHQIDSNKPLDDTQTENDLDESNLNETLYVTAMSGGDTTHDSTQLTDTGGALVDESQSSLSTARQFSLEAEFAKLKASENGKAKDDDDLIVEESKFLADVSPALESVNTTFNGDSRVEETVIHKAKPYSFVSIPEPSATKDQAKLDEDLIEEQFSEHQQHLLEESQVPDEADHREASEVKPLTAVSEDIFEEENLAPLESVPDTPKAQPYSFFPIPEVSATKDQIMPDGDATEKQVSEQQQLVDITGKTSEAEPLNIDSEDIFGGENSALPENQTKPDEDLLEEPLSEQQQLGGESQIFDEFSDFKPLPVGSEDIFEGEISALPKSAPDTPKVQPYSFFPTPEVSATKDQFMPDGDAIEEQVSEQQQLVDIFGKTSQAEPLNIDSGDIFGVENFALPEDQTKPDEDLLEEQFSEHQQHLLEESQVPDETSEIKPLTAASRQPDSEDIFEEENLAPLESAPDTPKVQPYSFFPIPEVSATKDQIMPDGDATEKQVSEQQQLVDIFGKTSQAEPLNIDSGDIFGVEDFALPENQTKPDEDLLEEPLSEQQQLGCELQISDFKPLPAGSEDILEGGNLVTTKDQVRSNECALEKHVDEN